jgi:hypothetical protein
MVLMPPEGAPEIARERIAIGRNAVLAQLAEAIRPGLGSGQASPDPELTARMISTLADDAVRLALTDPEQYPVERLLSHAQWMLGQDRVPADRDPFACDLRGPFGRHQHHSPGRGIGAGGLEVAAKGG